jgi:hypothetical protein
MMGSSTIATDVVVKDPSQEKLRKKFVFGTTVRAAATSQIPPANTSTPAWVAAKTGMERPTVTRVTEGLEGIIGMKPKYLRYNVWSPDVDPKMTAAVWTLTAKPLPRPSPDEFTSRPVSQTLADRPDLFKIVTPINVDA